MVASRRKQSVSHIRSWVCCVPLFSRNTELGFCYGQLQRQSCLLSAPLCPLGADHRMVLQHIALYIKLWKGSKDSTAGSGAKSYRGETAKILRRESAMGWASQSVEILKRELGYFQSKAHLEVASADAIQQQCEGSTEKAPYARIWSLLPMSAGVFTSAWERLPSGFNGRTSIEKTSQVWRGCPTPDSRDLNAICIRKRL